MTDGTDESASARALAAEEASLRARLASERVRERRDATLGLVDRGDAGLEAATHDALATRLDVDPDADVRQFAVEALGLAGAAPDTFDAALGDDDKWVRAEAVVALTRVAGSDAADRLRTALDDEAGPVRRNALVALAKIGAVAPATLRERLKDDPHEPVREYAAEWLGEHPGEEAETVRLLAAVLARDPAAFVRANAAGSLGRLGTDRAIETLETQGLEDRSNDVQRAAKRALATARGEDPAAIESDDPPAPGGGPRTPSGTPDGPSARQSNATRPTGRSPHTHGLDNDPSSDTGGGGR